MKQNSWKLAASLVFLMGCSLDFVPKKEEPEPLPSGDLGAFAQLSLASGAPSTVSLESGVALNIPEGAIDSAIDLRLERPPQAQAEAMIGLWTGSEKPLTAPHILTPAGTTFSELVVLTFPVEVPADTEYATAVFLDSEADTTWEVLGPVPVKKGRALMPIEQLGVYMLVEFDLANLELDGGLPNYTLEDLEGYGDFDGGIPDDFKF